MIIIIFARIVNKHFATVDCFTVTTKINFQPEIPTPADINAGIPVVANTHIGVSGKTFKDRYAKPNKIENWLLQREMQLQEFGNIVISFSVAGNSARHVGDLIKFEVPTSMAPDEMGSVELGHQLYSGYYIVSKIRHIITPTEYKTDLELIKNSFAKRIPGQKTKEDIGTGEQT